MDHLQFLDDCGVTTIRVTPQVRPLYTFYTANGREVAISYECQSHTYDYRKYDHVTFAINPPDDSRYDSSRFPPGEEHIVDSEQLDCLLTMFRNVSAKFPNGGELLAAMSFFTKDVLLGQILKEKQRPLWYPDWPKPGLDDPSIIDLVIKTLQPLGTLVGAFEGRYLVPDEIPWGTNDLDLAMEQSLRFGQVPIDLRSVR